MNTRSLLRSLLLAQLLFLTSCTEVMHGKVVAFHVDNLPMGESIRIEASDPAKGQSLEFREYARLIGAQLTRIGYTNVEDPAATATLIAQVDYSVEVGPTDVRLDRTPGPYVHYHFHYGHYYDPFYLGFDEGWDQQVISTPTYLRNFKITIVENTAARKHLFEGRVQSRGTQNQLPDIMPYLITAMFTNFPGESGVTKRVTIEMDE